MDRLRKLPWYLRYGPFGWRVMTRARMLAIQLTHRRSTVEFRGPVRLGPGFNLRIGDGGTLIVGRGVDFRRGFTCEIADHGRVVIGDGTTFTYHGTIRCSTAIEIGEGCAFGQLTVISDQDDDVATGFDGTGASGHGDPERPPLRIADGVGVSDKCAVYAEIGKRCLIASQSMVTRPIPAYCVAAGNPARPVRYFGPTEREEAHGR